MYTFICQGDTLKSELTLEQITEGDWCYDYISTGNYRIKIKADIFTENRSNSSVNFFSSNWRKNAWNWKILWSFSFAFNILIIILITFIIATNYYMR